MPLVLRARPEARPLPGTGAEALIVGWGGGRAGAAVAMVTLAVSGGLFPGAVAVNPSPPLPGGFFGVALQQPAGAGDLARMQGVVGTLRIPIYWWQCEPAQGEYDFGALDAEVAAAAARGIRIQPVVYGTPGWLSGQAARPPLGQRAMSAWTRFLHTLVRRYGSGGEFWRGRFRRLPIRLWQVWNEPNFVVFWKPWPNPTAYARLLQVSARAVRGVNPRAEIVLAGVAPVGAGMKTWVFLRRLFRVPGIRHDFDFVALHPYSANLLELDYQVRKVRQAMAAAGLGELPMLVTELGVASWGTYPSAFVEGPDGQARFLQAAYARLLQMRRRWHIAGVDWYTWRDQSLADPTCSFCQGAGLLGVDGKPKPAWWAYRRTVEAAGVR
jgi:polysaccharide biosynthesis protein PslG